MTRSMSAISGMGAVLLIATPINVQMMIKPNSSTRERYGSGANGGKCESDKAEIRRLSPPFSCCTVPTPSSHTTNRRLEFLLLHVGQKGMVANLNLAAQNFCEFAS